MAEKKEKKKQDTACRKEVNAEFRKGAGSAFKGGGNAAYQPRDANAGKPEHGSAGKRQTEKSMQAHQETFGQKVQKSGQEEKSGFGIMLLPGRTISASRRKWRKNSRIRKITTGGILTGSRRKKGNTTKNGCRRNTGAGKTQKIVPLRKMFLRRIREMPFRRMAVLILRAVKSCKKNSGRQKKPGRRYRRQGQSCQRQGNTLCREYLTRKAGRENMWLSLWIRKNPSGRRAYPKLPCAGCGMRAGILCMGRLLKRRKKIQRWRAHTNRNRKGKNCFLSSKGR